MKKNKIIVTTKSKIYPIFFGNNILNTTGNIIKKNLPNVKKICIISDNKIPKKFLKILTKSLRKYNYEEGKVSGTVYLGNNLEYTNLMIDTVREFIFSNPLHPDVYLLTRPYPHYKNDDAGWM